VGNCPSGLTESWEDDVSKRITIEYFAILREQRGLTREEWGTEARSPAELYQELQRTHQFSLSQASVRASINQEMVAWDHPLQDGDTVVFIPPVAGG